MIYIALAGRLRRQDIAIVSALFGRRLERRSPSIRQPAGSPASLGCARNSLQRFDPAQSMVAWTIPFERKAR